MLPLLQALSHNGHARDSFLPLQPHDPAFLMQVLTETLYTTLMRDHNGLGFSIAGGKGAAQYKEGSDVSDIGGVFFFRVDHKRCSDTQ